MTNKFNILAATAAAALLIGVTSAKATDDEYNDYWGYYSYDSSAANVEGYGWSNGGVESKPYDRRGKGKGYKHHGGGTDGPDTITGASAGYFDGSAQAKTDSAKASVNTSGAMIVIGKTTDGYVEGSFAGGGSGYAGSSNVNGSGWGWGGNTNTSTAGVAASNSSQGGIQSRGNAAAGTTATSSAGGSASSTPNSSAASANASGSSNTAASSSNGGSSSGGSTGGGAASAGASGSKSSGGAL